MHAGHCSGRASRTPSADRALSASPPSLDIVGLAAGIEVGIEVGFEVGRDSAGRSRRYESDGATTEDAGSRGGPGVAGGGRDGRGRGAAAARRGRSDRLLHGVVRQAQQQAFTGSVELRRKNA